MKTDKIVNLPLDKFINISLYNKKSGYYIKKNPFGKKGDFITAPNISRLFSEMIAIWVVSFWKSIGSPKEFNLIELGAGNAAMMKILIESFKKFPSFFKSCRLVIYEISPTLKKIQKKELLNSNNNQINEADALDYLKDSLDNSLKYHQIADVPITLLLSSGIDSNVLLAATSEKKNKNLNLLTLDFEPKKNKNETIIAEKSAKMT